MTDPDNLASKSVEDRMPEELSLAGDFPKVTHCLLYTSPSPRD